MSKQANGYYYHEEQYEGPDSPFKAGIIELDTLTCAHCQTIVLLNPKRQRSRGRCRNGDHYLCDACYGILDKTGCLSAQQKIDLSMAHPEADISIGQSRPTRDAVRLAEDTKPYPGIWIPGKD
jgi:hypothetical protein